MMIPFEDDKPSLRQEKFKGNAGTIRSVAGSSSLVPNWMLYIGFFITFSIPNLVFSGRSWYDTLHIIKWFVSMVPVAILAIVAGVQLFRHGAKRTNFTLDPFAGVWLILILLVTAQPIMINIPSLSGYAKEWFFFATLFAVYVLAYNLPISKQFHRVLLWGSSVNAAINVLFAELTFRSLNKGLPFILDVPGNYIGNTAQQEMFGLWAAMAVLNCVYLHLSYMDDPEEEKGLLRRPIVLLNLFFLAVNSWGLWSSTARGAILSLIVAFTLLVVGLWRTGEGRALKRASKLFGIVFLLLVIVLAGGSMLRTGRNIALVSKMKDMVENPTSVGNRISIWRTSWEVFLQKPVTGVGLGQYKWHFLDGQRNMFAKHPELLNNPEYEWQYTYWAHSEYIQWLCETGIVGAALLGLLGLWWLYKLLTALIKNEKLPPECIWGTAMLFLLWFDALFSRPYHRIENAVWMSLAFAVANKALLPSLTKWTKMDNDFVFKCFGGLMAGVSLYGLFFMYGGMRGDQLMYKALTQQGTIQQKYDEIKLAEKYLMARDEAHEQIGYLYLSAAQSQKNPEAFANGVTEHYLSFKKRPTSRLLFELVGLAKQIRNKELLQDLATYLKPGMFGISSDGEIISE